MVRRIVFGRHEVDVGMAFVAAHLAAARDLAEARRDGIVGINSFESSQPSTGMVTPAAGVRFALSSPPRPIERSVE